MVERRIHVNKIFWTLNVGTASLGCQTNSQIREVILAFSSKIRQNRDKTLNSLEIFRSKFEAIGTDRLKLLLFVTINITYELVMLSWNSEFEKVLTSLAVSPLTCALLMSGTQLHDTLLKEKSFANIRLCKFMYAKQAFWVSIWQIIPKAWSWVNR